MASSGIKISPNLDPFRKRQMPDVAGRLRKERDEHRRHADLMWAGTLTAMFTDHELRLLWDSGFLSQHDLDLLRRAGRPLQSLAPPMEG